MILKSIEKVTLRLITVPNIFNETFNLDGVEKEKSLIELNNIYSVITQV